MEDYPYTETMLEAQVQPYPNSIFEWGKKQDGCNLLTVAPKELILTLLPRVKAKFTRRGLAVLGLRYDSKEKDFTEDYLTGRDAVAAYNPESADVIYLIENGDFIKFQLIESRFSGKGFAEVKQMQAAQKSIVDKAIHQNLQGRVDLASHVEKIVNGKEESEDINLKEVRKTRKRAVKDRHRDFLEEV